jgi:hypothetical protein
MAGKYDVDSFVLTTTDGTARGTGDYQSVAAGQTDQALGAVGRRGDFLEALVVIPATLSPGAVQIKDGGGNAITLFAGGANSLTTLHPFVVTFGPGIRSAAGGWSVTTGSDVSVLAAGDFT